MFVDIVSQKLYNYWDRIGDLIASFFPNKIKADAVYFNNSIDCVPSELQDNEDFKWLKNFRDNEYKELNQKRKQVVHYQTTHTEYIKKNALTSDQEELLQTLQIERESLPEYYKNHANYALIGFEKTMNLLDKINVFLF